MIIPTDKPNRINAIHKPSDCLLLIAFSLTEEDFINDLQEQTNKDYAKGVKAQYKLLPHYLWLYHHAHLAQTIKNVVDQVQLYGVTVKLYTGLKDLQDLFAFRVVTLIAHFSDKKQVIELSDGLHTPVQFVAAVDKNFNGFWDLSVCNSVFLQDELKRTFGDEHIVRANREKAEIRFHLILYKNIIERLLQVNSNYFTEMIDLRLQLAPLLQSKT